MNEINEDNPIDYYFNQFWACRNPQIFSNNDLRVALLNVWNECWDFMKGDTSRNIEGWLGKMGDAYESRVKMGKEKFYTACDKLDREKRLFIGHNPKKSFRALIFSLFMDYKNGKLKKKSIERAQFFIEKYNEIDKAFVRRTIKAYEKKMGVSLRDVLNSMKH